jgi:hypothetical protein
MLVGSRLQLGHHIVPLDDKGSPRLPSQVLLIVYSDLCSACKENISQWDELLAGLPIVSGSEVWVVTVNTTEGLSPTLNHAVKKGHRIRLFRAQYPDALGYATGINGTPVTAVVDGQGDIRAAVLGPLRNAAGEITASWQGLARD